MKNYNGREPRTPGPALQPRVVQLERRIARSLATSSRQDGGDQGESSRKQVARDQRSFASWDPSSSYPSEQVNWYEEHIARHARLFMSWLPQPIDFTKGSKERHEIRGLGLKHSGGESIVVAPLDDGSVCLWNIGWSSDVLPNANSGRMIARSKPGLLMSGTSESDSGREKTLAKSNLAADGVVECVSVDEARNKVYFAVESGLNEIDLETLQLIAHDKYPYPICALSETSYPTPLTVGTTFGLHLHDPRLSHNAPTGSQNSDRLDSIATFPTRLQLCRDLRSMDSFMDYAPLFDPGPLSILHQPFPNGIHDTVNGNIYVAGRFSSILAYERRKFPELRDTFHSGARLCSLALLDPVPGATAPKSLVAGGQYNGKGSLEIYPLADPKPPSSSYYRNRTSASSSKILSVITHGTRLLHTDGNGMLTWVERDGHTLVRRWAISNNTASAAVSQQPISETSGLFSNNSLQNRGDVGRKLLSTGPGATDTVLLWTGEKVGVIGFRGPVFAGADDGGGEGLRKDDNGGDETSWEKMREVFDDRMRLLLEAQADEVRAFPGLGLPD